MHVIIGLLGTAITILILLNRLADAGIDLGGYNPFLWQLRRKWQKQYQGNPIYQLEKPMEVTAVLMVAMAKCDGRFTIEEKRKILELFRDVLKLSRRDAAGLLIASEHILKDQTAINDNLNHIMAPSIGKFTHDQIESTHLMVSQVALVGGESSPAQKLLLSRVESILKPASKATTMCH